MRADAPSAPTSHDGLERFGRYEIVHKLASGGMGEVYLARSVGAAGFQKHVVIKKLLPHLVEQTQFVEGLIREAKLLVRLDHPNIVQVLDLGMEGSDYFMAMEYVHGYNLATIIHYCAQSQRVIPVGACASITLQVLAGLGYAHTLIGPDGVTQNVIHRDVSPQNVLISTEGRVKLTDFGIAKIVNESEGEFTQSLKGKFRYMAPEVVEGGRIDHRYDLFAVGILLFETLCRRHLFSGSNDVNILAQVRKAHVPPIARYHPEVPREVVQVAEKALGREPAKRYQSANEFIAALRQAVSPTTDEEALGILRGFVTDLFGRSDFPLNKPKLPDLNAISASVTRSLVLHSRLAVHGGKGGRRRSRSRLLALGVAVAVAAVGAGAYVVASRLMRPQTDPGGGKAPVIIVNAADAAPAKRLPDAAPVAVQDDTPDARVKRPIRPNRPLPKFDQTMGATAFRKAEGPIKKCLGTHSGDKELQLLIVTTVAGSGRVKAVKIEPGALQGTPIGQCLLGVARRIKYPAHADTEVDFKQPLRVARKP
jgi:serine/threonine protein kinase